MAVNTPRVCSLKALAAGTDVHKDLFCFVLSEVHHVITVGDQSIILKRVVEGEGTDHSEQNLGGILLWLNGFAAGMNRCPRCSEASSR